MRKQHLRSQVNDSFYISEKLLLVILIVTLVVGIALLEGLNAHTYSGSDYTMTTTTLVK